MLRIINDSLEDGKLDSLWMCKCLIFGDLFVSVRSAFENDICTLRGPLLRTTSRKPETMTVLSLSKGINRE